MLHVRCSSKWFNSVDKILKFVHSNERAFLAVHTQLLFLFIFYLLILFLFAYYAAQGYSDV